MNKESDIDQNRNSDRGPSSDRSSKSLSPTSKRYIPEENSGSGSPAQRSVDDKSLSETPSVNNKICVGGDNSVGDNSSHISRDDNDKIDLNLKRSSGPNKNNNEARGTLINRSADGSNDDVSMSDTESSNVVPTRVSLFFTS